MNDAITQCQASIARHSKSFALASRLLPRGQAQDAAVIYAWCRRADDAIDHSDGKTQADALTRMRGELDNIYADTPDSDPVLLAFHAVVKARAIPQQYPTDLLAGMEMDVRGQEYENVEQLLLYCYRVASTVGLMMCHVMGVSELAALRHAAHLGLGMQLTNICRDVLEDWQRGRLYLPGDVLRRHGVSLRAGVGLPFPARAAEGCRGALEELLGLAQRYYTSSDLGLQYLPLRSALSVGAARRIYSAIGREIAERGHDVRAPRAVVPGYKKLYACTAAAASVARHVRSVARPFQAAPLHTVTHGPELIAL